MSRLSTDRLFVALQPDRVALVRQRGRWRRRIVAKHMAPCSPDSGWAGAVSALAAALTDPAWQRCRVEVVLSARFVRTAVMRPPPGIRSGEALRLAQHCLKELNGDEGAGWQILFGDAAWNGPRVVCAVDPKLLEALETAIGVAQGRLASIRPFATTAFDARRACFAGGNSWFAAVEPGWCTLARVESGSWTSVRTRRRFSDAGGEISPLLAQEALLADTEALPERIVIAAPNSPHLGIPGFDGVPALLRPRAGFSPVDDASVAMALEGCR